MAYTPHTWSSGDVITAELLNALEQGAAKALTAHPTVSKSNDTTSTASPSAGGTVTVIDSVTRDSYGHVTKVNTKTITLPSSGSGTAGADGGYYTPAVSAAGVLSWTASKTGMAAVASTDLGALIQSYVEDVILGGTY